MEWNEDMHSRILEKSEVSDPLPKNWSEQEETQSFENIEDVSVLDREDNL